MTPGVALVLGLLVGLNLPAGEPPRQSVGGGLLLPGTQSVLDHGRSLARPRLYQVGPVVDFCAHWLPGSWVEPRLRATAFHLFQGSGRLPGMGAADGEATGLQLSLEAQLHLGDPARTGGYVVLGLGGRWTRVSLLVDGLTPTDRSFHGTAATLALGVGLRLARGWEVELRADGALATQPRLRLEPSLADLDPDPGGVVLLTRRRF